MIEKEFHAAVLNENIIVHHLKFLKTAYYNDDLRKPHYLANAIRRYETLWLPLMVKMGKAFYMGQYIGKVRGHSIFSLLHKSRQELSSHVGGRK